MSGSLKRTRTRNKVGGKHGQNVDVQERELEIGYGGKWRPFQLSTLLNCIFSLGERCTQGGPKANRANLNELKTNKQFRKQTQLPRGSSCDFFQVFTISGRFAKRTFKTWTNQCLSWP